MHSKPFCQERIDLQRNYELIHLWRRRMKFDRLSGITGRTIVFRSPETSGMLHPLRISISFPSTISISWKCNTALRNEYTVVLLYSYAILQFSLSLSLSLPLLSFFSFLIFLCMKTRMDAVSRQKSQIFRRVFHAHVYPLNFWTKCTV